MLREFQRNFSRGLLEQPATPARTGERESLRYAVHARNTRVSLRKVLDDVFPVIRQLVGVDFFEATAARFVVAHPPADGWLSAYGKGFPEFVAHYPPASGLEYLPDVARVEWARIRAANAPDDPGLDLNGLARMDPEALAESRLSVHAATTVIRSPFPVFSIWRAHHNPDTDSRLARIDLAQGAENVLVSRTGTREVQVCLLTAGDDTLLSALARDSTFDTACRAALVAERGYDLGTRLGELVRARVFAAHRQANPSGTERSPS